MSNMVFSSSSRQFTIDSILSDTIKTLFAHPKLFFGLALVAWLPGAVLGFFIPSILFDFSKTLLSPLNFIMTLLIQGAAAFAVLSVLQGRGTDVRAALSEGLMNRFAPLFALSLLIGAINLPLGIAGAGVKLAVMMSGFASFMSGVRGMGAGLSGGGFLLFLLMLLSSFIMCILYFAVPICVMECAGPFESLRRSAALTLGYRLRIFGLIVISNIIFYCLLKLVLLPLNLFFFWFPFLRNLASLIVMIVPQTFLCVLPSIAYYRLKELKEGTAPRGQTAGAKTAR